MTFKNFSKRFLCFILALVLAVAAVGCDKNEEEKKKKKVIYKKKVVTVLQDDEQDDENESDDGNQSQVQEDDFYIRREIPNKQSEYEEIFKPEFSVKEERLNLTSDYVIVYSDDVMYANQNAANLQEYFKKNANLELNIKEENNTQKSEKKILIGNTKFLKTQLKTNEFKVYLSGNDLVFAGGHFMMVESAVDWFMTLEYKAGSINLLTGKNEGFASVKTTSNGLYDYVWGDEFTGNKIDSSKWFQGHMTDPESTLTATQENCPEAFSVSDGMLKMSQIRYYNDEYPQYQYANGISVCNKDRMGYVFGYAEIRAKVPFVRGSWPSWWLCGLHPLGLIKDQYFVEVDIFEIFANKNTVSPNIHKWFYDDSFGRTHTQYNEGYRKAKQYIFDDYSNLNNEYHIYGFEWTNDEMIMSVDGEEYLTLDLNSNYDGLDDMEEFKNNPLEFVLSSMLCTTDNNNSDELWYVNNEDLPFHYYIDYIRLYQNKNQKGNKLYVKDVDGSTLSLWD